MAQRTEGTDRIFDRETLLDLTVNFIPLGIILFFIVLFAVFDPFDQDLVATVISQGLLVIPFAALAVLTYFAGKVITEAERYGESDTAETVAESTIGMGEGAADEADTDGTGTDDGTSDAGDDADDRPAIEGETSGDRSASEASDAADTETAHTAADTDATAGDADADGRDTE